MASLSPGSSPATQVAPRWERAATAWKRRPGRSHVPEGGGIGRAFPVLLRMARAQTETTLKGQVPACTGWQHARLTRSKRILLDRVGGAPDARRRSVAEPAAAHAPVSWSPPTVRSQV